MTCRHCGAENRPDRRFCTTYGASLARICPACGVPLDLALCGVGAATLLPPEDRPAELVEEARAILEGLGAAPLLAQLSSRIGALTT